MPTKKIAELPDVCTHPDHNVPMHQHFEPGVYEHTCPSCGMVKRFIVQRSTMSLMNDAPEYNDESPEYITGTEDGV